MRCMSGRVVHEGCGWRKRQCTEVTTATRRRSVPSVHATRWLWCARRATVAWRSAGALRLRLWRHQSAVCGPHPRMALGRCVETEMGHIGCQRDVLTPVDRRCSGRRRCELRIPDAELESTRPCLRELKSYLEAAYTCVPGTSWFDFSWPLWTSRIVIVLSHSIHAYKLRADLFITIIRDSTLIIASLCIQR